jgi:hypothetical protein
MRTVMGLESPKRYMNGEFDILQIVAEPAGDGSGRWQATYDAVVSAAHHDPEDLANMLKRQMLQESKAGRFDLPNVLQVIFIAAPYGLDSIKHSLMCCLREPEKYDHKWDSAWKSLVKP